MNKILIALYIFSLISCTSSSDDTSSNNSSSDDNSTQTSSIIGTWSYTYPTSQCIEIYTFNSDNTFSVLSENGEYVGGTYSFTSQVTSNNRHNLSFTVTSDNLQFDCDGNTSDDTGVTIDVFMEFVEPSVVDWYEQTSGGAPIITITKEKDESSGVTTMGPIIFVTKSSHVGDYANDPTLTGSTAIEKADSFCNIDENKPNDSVYKALLTDGATRDAVSLTDWILEENTTYYRSYGNIEIGTTKNTAIFAALYVDLTNSISILLPDPVFNGENRVVTGIGDASTFAADPALTCNSWSDGTDIFSSSWGRIYKKNEDAFVLNGSLSCAFRNHLYCVEQP